MQKYSYLVCQNDPTQCTQTNNCMHCAEYRYCAEYCHAKNLSIVVAGNTYPDCSTLPSFRHIDHFVLSSSRIILQNPYAFFRSLQIVYQYNQNAIYHLAQDRIIFRAEEMLDRYNYDLMCMNLGFGHIELF